MITRPTPGDPARLRVLAVNSMFPNAQQPYYGIFNALALQYLKPLAEVRVVSPVKWCPGLAWASKSERRLQLIPARSEYEGMTVTHPRFFRTPGFGRSWHGWMYRMSVERHLREVAAEFKPDVLLASWAYPDGWAVQELGERLGLPVVIKCLGSDLHQYLKQGSRGRQVVDALLRCDRVVMVSEGLRRLAREQGVPAEKIDLVYNGVDRRLFHPRPRNECRRQLRLAPHGKMLLCVANLLPIKRHADLLQAFGLLRERYGIEANLVLVGDGPLRTSLERLARTIRGGPYIRFVGGCRQEQVPLWMGAADAVCLASENEGLPNVLVEALACGRPVVATRVGGIPELVSEPEHGRLVEAGDVEAMASALKDVLGHAWDPQQLAACPQVISWEESARLLLDSLRAARRGHRSGDARGVDAASPVASRA